MDYRESKQKMGFFKMFSKNAKPESTAGSFYQSLYPETVRYALSYRDALMSKVEIRSLVDRFTNEALYLVIKALDDVEAKRLYLEDLTRLFIKPDYQDEDLKVCLYRWIDKIPEDKMVAGTKLAQLSRCGSDNWQESFQALAQRCYDDDQTALPLLIAHTAILGFQHFVQLYKDVPKAHIIVVLPDWMIDKSNDLMGYDVVLSPKVRVDLQEKSQCLSNQWSCYGANCPLNHVYCGNTYYVDDTIHSGATAGKITSFWYSEYGLSVPDEKIRVITDLRKS